MLIGPFAGPVAIQVELSGDPKLREVLANVQEVILNSLNHAELPFEVLLDKLRFAPSMGEIRYSSSIFSTKLRSFNLASCRL